MSFITNSDSFANPSSLLQRPYLNSDNSRDHLGEDDELMSLFKIFLSSNDSFTPLPTFSLTPLKPQPPCLNFDDSRDQLGEVDELTSVFKTFPNSLR